MELKLIDPNASSFTANGKEYFRHNHLSIDRAVYMELAMIEIERGLKVGSQLEDWIRIYDIAGEAIKQEIETGKKLGKEFQKQAEINNIERSKKMNEILVIAYNNRRGFSDFFGNQFPILKIVACFYNTEDEDIRSIDDELVKRKATDWREEGIAAQSFFPLALTLVSIEVANSKNATAHILEQIKIFNQTVSANTTAINISN